MAGVDLIVIAVGAVGAMALGALWYSPLLFGRTWLQAIGKTPDQLGSAMPAMVGSFASCLLAAGAVDYLVVATGATDPLSGLLLGLLLGFGLVATSMLSDNLFCGWGLRLYLVQASYRVAYLALMGLVSGSWPR